MFQSPRVFQTTLAPLVCLLLTLTATSQGEFVNFETPQVKPITVATVGTGALARDFLLVCNTPDNSVEVYDAHAPFTFIKRVPVGISPVSVRWSKPMGRFFTANFNGDSVTVVRLVYAASTQSNWSLDAIVDASNIAGDEPSDVALFPSTETVIATLNSQSAVSMLTARDLSLAVPRFDLVDFDEFTGFNFAVKQPRTIQPLSDGRAYVLNFMGDQLGPAEEYDLDLFIHDPTTGDADTFSTLGGLGTTNHSFAIDASKTRMFVVGTRARNQDAVGVQEVSALKTGFVQSWMWVVQIPPGQAPWVVEEASIPGGGGPIPVTTELLSINLNRDYNQPGLEELPPELALSQPTDIVLLEGTDNPSGIDKIFVTAYHSDTVAVLMPDPGHPSGWFINRIPIPVLSQPDGYRMAGPRGLALSSRARSPYSPTRPGLVYSLNRLNNTVSVLSTLR